MGLSCAWNPGLLFRSLALACIWGTCVFGQNALDVIQFRVGPSRLDVDVKGKSMLFSTLGEKVRSISLPGAVDQAGMPPALFAGLLRFDLFEGRPGACRVQKVNKALPEAKEREDVLIGTYLEFDAFRWNQLAYVELRYDQEGRRFPATLFGFFPLKNGTFLAVGRFYQDKKAYPFSILRRNAQGRLEVDSCFDLGLDEPTYDPKTGQERQAGIARSLQLSDVFRSGGRLVFVMRGLGLFVALDEENGTLKRTIFHYPDVPLNVATLMPVITCAQPLDDDRILFSATDLKMHETYEKAHADLFFKPQLRSPMDLMHEMEKKAVMEYPEIHWFTFDPAEGKIAPTPAPAGARTVVNGVGDILRCVWSISPDGKVIHRIPSHASESTTPPPKEEAEKAEASTKKEMGVKDKH